jgi:hypothetical protein
MKSTQEKIQNLLAEYDCDLASLKDALCDGEFLKAAGIDQDQAEELHSFCMGA